MINEVEWGNMTPYKKYRAKDTSGNIVRISREDTTGFIYSKGRSRYGRRLPINQVMTEYTLCETTDENELWQKRLDRAINAMTKSGLWVNIRELFTKLKLMNYYDKKKMGSLYWETFDIKTRDLSVDEYNEWFMDKFSEYVNKYDFCFKLDKEGRIMLDTKYIFEISECNLKSMYFGKYTNKITKEEIKRAIMNHKSYSIPYVRTSYDVSFRYDAEKNAATYAEEYRDCGNGHYYIALDENTALFAEND